MEERIKALVKELFDSGMSLDEILFKFATAATAEDYKRFKEGGKNED